MYQRHDFGGAVALDTSDLSRFGRRALAPTTGGRFDDLDLVVDLGARIGSREWWRGLATLLALLASAWLLAPPALGPLTLPSAPAYDGAQWDEARAQAIAPLAEGADTGRRMAPTDAVQPLAEAPERPQIDVAATLGLGDGFARVLERAGVAPDEAKHAADLVAGAVPMDQLTAGTHIDLTLGRRASKSVPRPLDHLAFRATFEMRLALERVNGALTLVKMPIPIDETPLHVTGTVGGGLYLAARSAGAPPAAVASYIHAVATRVAMDELEPDDRFDMVVAQRRAATGEVRIGDLLYAGITHEGHPLGLMRWAYGGREQWFDQTGTGETTGAMRMPVEGHLTSSFGMRFHPILGYSRMHKGVDYGAPTGTPIVAATDGTVVFAGWHGGHGNFVQVKQSNAFGTGYGHMSRIVAQVGQHVQAGQLIGYVGATGLATGPHLHFEVYENGQAVDPTGVRFTATARLSPGELASFRARMGALVSSRLASAGAAAGKKAG